MKTYILNCSPLLDPSYVNGVLSGSPSVLTWFAAFPSSYFLISHHPINELGAILHMHFGDAWFLLTEANQGNTNGWLPSNFWEWINDPQGHWTQEIFSRFPTNNKESPKGLSPGIGGSEA